MAYPLYSDFNIPYVVSIPILFLICLFIVWNEPRSWKDKAVLKYPLKNYLASSAPTAEPARGVSDEPRRIDSE